MLFASTYFCIEVSYIWKTLLELESLVLPWEPGTISLDRAADEF